MGIKKAVKLAITLFLFCAVSAGLLAYVYVFTTAQIEANSKKKFESSLQQVCPGADQFVRVGTSEEAIYLGKKTGQTIGSAILVKTRGYSADIVMLVGVDLNGKILGVNILDQKETPGLGANIGNINFIGQFIGRSNSDALEPKKDIQAITGATISSRAVCDGVKKALKAIKQ